jgi:DNA-directed RNA polymerase subunit RPC12/RpoP
MVVVEMKCSMCGHRFQAKLLDRQDPKEERVQGVPLCCPRCNSQMVEKVRVIRRAS